MKHDGVTQSFDLGSTGTSAYGCHFVAHYADCEHEIQQVTSGYRVALVYSLCFTGSAYQPMAADIANQTNLKRILRCLPFHERICMIPLGHPYTTASLARYGLNALKGDDTSSQEAIQAASEGTWKFIIAQVSKTDEESGEGDSYDGFSAQNVEEGVPLFTGQAFGADGSDCTADLTWLNKVADFSSAQQGGMVMLTEDVVEDMWGEGDSESVEYTGDGGGDT